MRKAACFVVFMCMVIGLFAVGAWGDVPIDEAHFPDATFRAYVMKNFDRDSDGILSDNETAEAKSVYLSYGAFFDSSEPPMNHEKIPYVTSLEGIEYLSALTSLTCKYNGLTYLDVSQNSALTEIDCQYNRITMINLKGCSSLKTLECDHNLLSAIDANSLPRFNPSDM